MATRAAEWERALREADNGKEPLRDVFIRLFLEADSRLAGVEGTASSVAALQALMTQDANTLINAVVTPLLAQIRAAADMGALFSATSVTETAIGTGVKTFTIPVGMRTAFAPAAQLAIVAADDPAKAMWARKLGYDKDTGLLTVDVYSTQGAGLVSSWSITAGIAASMAAHVAVAATGLVPLGNLQGALSAISAALANDPAFGTGVIAALAARYTKAETDALLAGRQAATAASQLLAGLTPAGDRLPYFSAGDGAALTPLSGFWRSVLGAADDGAARTLLKVASAHNPRVTGNLRFGARTPINAIFLADADTAAVCVYDTRLDSDGGTWRSRTQDTLAFVIAQSTNRGARRDFPAIAVVAMETTFSQVRIYDAEEVDSNGVPSMWAISSLPVSAQVRRIKAANGFICVASANGLGVVDIPGDGRRVYFADRVSYYTPLGDSIHVSFAKIRDDLTKNIPSTDTKDVDLRVFAGAPIGTGGLPIPTIAVATAAGASIIFPSGEIVDITRSGGYVGVSLDSDTRLRLVTPEGNVEVGPIPTIDVVDTAWRAHAWPPTLGPVVSVAGAAEATTRGLLMRSESPTGYDLGLTAHIGPTHNTGWMPPNTRRALFCDSIPMAMTGVAPLADDCTSTTGWTLGAGWSHDATEFDHASGTAALDRALTGLIAGVRYRVRFLIGNRSAGSLAVSLLTAGDEAGALSVAASGEHVFGFTAGATTDTLRFVPTTDFNGSVQDVRVEVSVADRSIVGRDALVLGAMTAVSTAGIGELRPLGGWGASNGISDAWTSDLDFPGDFCVAFNSQLVANNTTVVQRASAPASGARWEVRFTTGTVHFDINDGTNGATVSAAVQTTTDYSLFVFVRRESAIEIWQAGVLTATASAAGVGSLANPAAGIRYGARVDGSQAVSSSFRLRGLVIAASAPTAEQVATMYLGGRDIIQPASLCCLGGATRAVARVSRDPITDQVAAAAEGVAVFKGLMRTDRISTETSLIGNNAVIDVAMRGATIAAASPAGGFCYRSELAAVMVESANIGRASVDHEHRAATLTLPGFMSPADKAKLDGPMPARDIGDAQLTAGKYTAVADDHGRALVFATTGAATLVLPAGLPRGTVVTVARGTQDVLIEAGAGATVTFQYAGDTKVARANGRVTVDNLKAANAWVVSEGTV